MLGAASASDSCRGVLATQIHASAIKKKLKKLNCNFIVPFDRFPATFVAPELFVTVALSSHCCRAVCTFVCLCASTQVLEWMRVTSHILSLPFFPPGFHGSLLSQSTLNIHRSYTGTIAETSPHKYNHPTGSLMISAYMHLQIHVCTCAFNRSRACNALAVGGLLYILMCTPYSTYISAYFCVKIIWFVFFFVIV